MGFHKPLIIRPYTYSTLGGEVGGPSIKVGAWPSQGLFPACRCDASFLGNFQATMASRDGDDDDGWLNGCAVAGFVIKMEVTCFLKTNEFPPGNQWLEDGFPTEIAFF